MFQCFRPAAFNAIYLYKPSNVFNVFSNVLDKACLNPYIK
jgi:hypothetical protein